MTTTASPAAANNYGFKTPLDGSVAELVAFTSAAGFGKPAKPLSGPLMADLEHGLRAFGLTTLAGYYDADTAILRFVVWKHRGLYQVLRDEEAKLEARLHALFKAGVTFDDLQGALAFLDDRRDLRSAAGLERFAATVKEAAVKPVAGQQDVRGTNGYTFRVLPATLAALKAIFDGSDRTPKWLMDNLLSVPERKLRDWHENFGAGRAPKVRNDGSRDELRLAFFSRLKEQQGWEWSYVENVLATFAKSVEATLATQTKMRAWQVILWILERAQKGANLAQQGFDTEKVGWLQTSFSDEGLEADAKCWASGVTEAEFAKLGVAETPSVAVPAAQLLTAAAPAAQLPTGVTAEVTVNAPLPSGVATGQALSPPAVLVPTPAAVVVPTLEATAHKKVHGNVERGEFATALRQFVNPNMGKGQKEQFLPWVQEQPGLTGKVEAVRAFMLSSGS